MRSHFIKEDFMTVTLVDALLKKNLCYLTDMIQEFQQDIKNDETIWSRKR